MNPLIQSTHLDSAVAAISSRRTARWLSRGLVAVSMLFATSAFADDAATSAPAPECTSKAASDALVACPNTGPTQFDVTKHGKAPVTNFHSAPPPADLKKRDQQTKPGGPTESMSAAQRDERTSRLKPKVRALLITEIQGLENLYQSTPASSPDRVQVARRLAEDYVELESAASRDKTENEIKADEAKKTAPGSEAKLKAEADKAAKVIVAARKKAIEYYSMIKDKFPNYGQLDEVLYYLAYEYEQANDLDNARKVYFELIQKAPQSKYIPNAYLAFGELFFNEAQGDPSKWELAQGAYAEVIKYPPPNNKVFGYAHYKLAYVNWNKGDFPHALDEFKKTIDYGVQFSSIPNAAQLAIAARRDIIPVYALAGKPEAAYNFFHNISGDGAAETAKTFKMMDDLGQNYIDTGHYPEGIALYHDLMGRDKGENFCRYQALVTQATMAMKGNNKANVKVELDRQIEVYNAYKNQPFGDESKLKCANLTAELVAETAMAWHLEAVGSGGVRGTGNKETMSLAALLYKKVVDNFPSEQFAKFEFPRIVKDDWPTIFKIKYAMADLLYFEKNWAECGPAFDSVVEEAPDSPEAPEAAYAAVLCYQNIYAETHKEGSDRKGSGNMPGQAGAKKGEKADESAKYRPKDLTAQQSGMLKAFNRYICYIKPSEGDKQGQDQLVEVKYARARTYFEAQHWDEAALAFRDIAVNYADKDVGIYAMQLYLESLNVLGAHSEPPKPGCFAQMATDVPLFLKLYCDGSQKNVEQCTTLTKIQCDIQRLEAETLVKKADGGGATALRDYEEAGNKYIALWRKYGEEPLRAKQPMQCEKMDEVVYNAARAYQAARLVAKAIKVRSILIDPSNMMEKSDLARKSVYEIGGNYQAIAVYDAAATWYERYATQFAKAENSDKALSDATVLRLGLGQEDEAIKDADLFNRTFGQSHATQAAQIAFAVGAHYVEKEDWDKARQRLQGAIGLIEKSASLDVVVQAHALLGRVYIKIRSENNAKNEYAKVKSLWADPKSAEAKIMAIAGEDEGAKTRRLAKALTAVGEAYFYFAEQKRADAERILFPAYHGPDDKVAILKHISGAVKAWVDKKRPAIEAAEAEYRKITELQPVPPPKWVIAAGSQAGSLWGNFVRDFRAAPIPGSIKKDVELRNAYYGGLDESSEPLKLRAKAAFETCLGLSVKHQFFDEYSRKCELWLSKNYKNEYHAIDEFKAAPTNVGSATYDKPYPVQIGGEVFNETPPPAAPPPVETPAKADEDKKPEKAEPAKKAEPAPKKKAATAAPKK